jgi:hypothetical protein
MYTLFWLEDVKGRDHSEDLGVDGKGKVVPCAFLTEHQAMKVYWGSRGIAPLI